MGSLIATIKQFIIRHRFDLAIALVILVVALLPRVLDLGTFLTADEKNWIGRSYEFIRAFKDVRLNDMLQTTHPGVIPMWLMGLSVTAQIFLSGTPFSFQTLPNFIVAAQLPMAVATSVLVPVMYLFLRRLPWPGITSQRQSIVFAAATSLFVALNPFIVGYSRVAHVDALLAGLLFLAALATIIYVQRGYSRTWLIVSAVLSALAILTKAPGIFMVPFWWLAVVASAALFRKGAQSHAVAPRVARLGGPPGTASSEAEPSLPKARGKAGETGPTAPGTSGKLFFASRLRDFLVWSLVVAVMFVTIWPVFINVPNPKGNVNILRKDLGVATATPHHRADDYALNAWQYPAALVTRTTPLTLLFAIVAIGGLAVYLFRSRVPKDQALTALLIVAYVVFFIIMMTIGAKKGDRYILPVFPALDTLAVVGVALIGGLFARARALVLPVIGLLGTFYLAFVVATYHPYTIAYANPLFPDNLSQELGWGEGLEQVGAWLSQADPEARVASWYPQELGAYTSAQAVNLSAHDQQTVAYVVLYRNMFGRAADHPANDYIDEYYTKRKPVFVAQVAGKPFAWVYPKQTYPGVRGELTPGVVATETLATRSEPVAALELMFATYSGRANTGSVVVDLTDASGQRLHTWQVPVADLTDNGWERFVLPEPIQGAGPLQASVRTTGTVAGAAPTIRTQDSGALAARLLYEVEDDLAHSEHTKLLP